MSHPDLSTILEVYPECENTCYGYAPSQRRRCRMRTRKDNRDRASYLLKEGTRFLQHGLPVNGLLIELAPLVLCTRFHQYQADDLVSDWRAKLRAFQQQTLLTAMLKSLQELSAGQRFSERVSSPTRLERSAAIDREEEEEERGDREDEPGREPEPELTPSRTSTETSSPAVETHVAEPTVPQSEPRRTTRKPIEGDCDICMCPLREQDSDENGEGPEDSDDENDDDDAAGTGSDIASDEHDGPEEHDVDDVDDLVYCKNQCGTNYHKACINVWLATQRTFRTPRGDPIGLSCPNCRAAWSS